MERDCWLYAGYLNRDGYGQIVSYSQGKQICHLVHRVIYESLTGQTIPPKMTLDHLCRIRSCMNPEHLEVVTSGENVLRGNTLAAKNKLKTHCINGHPLSGDNLYIRKDRLQRGCKMCRKISVDKYNQRKRG